MSASRTLGKILPEVLQKRRPRADFGGAEGRIFSSKSEVFGVGFQHDNIGWVDFTSRK